MDKSVLVDLALDLLVVLAPAVLALIGLASKKLADFVNAKAKNEYLAGCLVRLDTVLFTLVKEMFQTVVDDLKAAKADGKLDDAEKAAIKAKVLESIKSHYGAKGLKELLVVLGLNESTLDQFLNSKIEAAVYETKPYKSCTGSCGNP